jgi:hypothetical protein
MDRGKGYNLDEHPVIHEIEPERPPELPTEVYPTSNIERSEPKRTEREVEPKKNPMSAYTPHIILGVVALLSIVALAAMAYAPGTETQFIQNTLGSIALAATAALAGIIKGPGT